MALEPTCQLCQEEMLCMCGDESSEPYFGSEFMGCIYLYVRFRSEKWAIKT